MTDSYGRQLTFTYNNTSLATMTTPDGQTYRYVLDSGGFLGTTVANRLTQVIYPDTTPADPNDNPRVTYLFENSSFPFAITGIVDERGVRVGTYTYDAKLRALTSEKAGGVEAVSIAYNDSDGSRTVTNALGKSAVYRYATVLGVRKLTRIEGQASANCAAANAELTYNTSGYITSRRDWRGTLTQYTRDSRGLELTRTEAAGTAEARVTTTTWHSTFHLPTQIVEPGRTTDFTYDANGWLLSRTVTDTTTHTVPYATNGRTRTWTYTWHTNGELASIDGPRADVADVTSFGLDTAGFVNATTNALSHVGQVVSRDAAGRITRVSDANAVETSFVYDERGRLASWTRHGHVSGDATTAYTYDPAGNVTSVAEPLRSAIDYVYDDANRLIRIVNADNERIEIARDLLGNVTARETYTAANALAHTWTATYDEMGRPLTQVGSTGQTTGFGYDTNSNLTQVTDPRSGVTAHLYDLHDRLKQSTDALLGVAGQAYDARDNPTGATDPKGVATVRIVDGFDHVIRESSPDTGTTDYEYDAAGNLTQLTDARGKVSTFTYDALNRMTAKQFAADAPRNQAFTWDDATAGYYGIGRLATASDVAGSTAFTYSSHGLVERERRVQGGQTYDTIYVWDRDGSLFDLTLPSGRKVEYRRDTHGRISVVRLKETPVSASIDLANSFAYSPYGPMASFIHGNGLALQLGFTQDYREASRAVGGGTVQSLTHTYDASGNMVTRNDLLTPARSETFGYDALDRLTSASGLYGSVGYSLDANANRTSRSIGAVTETYSYAAGTNRLTGVSSSAGTRSFTQLASGHTASDDRGGGDILLYSYDDEGRLVGITRQGSPTATYAYDSRGRRVQRTLIGTPNTVRLAIHRLDGRLLAEHDETTGAVVSETIRLDDGTPLALITGPQGTRTLRYIHPDHLGTPRLMTGGTGAVVWDAVYQPFGELQAMSGAGSDERFPGQQFDTESGLHQNHYRTYDPSTGRYIEPDPISLGGGWNRFAYVEGNPLSLIDPAGQSAGAVAVGVAAAIVGDIALQLALKGCVDLREVAVAGGLGAAGGAVWGLLPRLRNLLPLLSRAPNAAKVPVAAPLATPRIPEVAQPAPTKTVGRHMSPEELAKMRATGRVQEGGGGQTRVADPASPSAYRNPPKGDVYVEFDIPSERVLPHSQGTGRIPGPNSIDARIPGRNPADYEMPAATNIRVYR